MRQRRNPEELHALLQFWVGLLLSLTLFFTVMSVLYSLIFVTQPIDAQAPNDKEFFKVINTIVGVLVGSMTTLMAVNHSSQKKEKEE
jgi:heme/copper-type cytochrome/quinol oxidase subunit 3